MSRSRCVTLSFGDIVIYMQKNALLLTCTENLFIVAFSSFYNITSSDVCVVKKTNNPI